MSFTQSAMCRMRAAIRCLRRCNALPAVCQLQDAYYIELGPPAEQHLDLMLRGARSARLEAWAASPSFETRSFGPLLRMRSECNRLAVSALQLQPDQEDIGVVIRA